MSVLILRHRLLPLFMALTLVATGCGRERASTGWSRTTLGATEDSSGTDADVVIDSGADGGGSIQCRQLDGPIQIFGDDGLNYVAPTVVSRGGGFDVVAFLNNGAGAPSHATVAQRVEVLPSNTLQLSAYSALDNETSTADVAATDGELLATCQGAINLEERRVLTFQTFHDSYALRARVRRAQSETMCYALAGRRDRWITFWLGVGDIPPMTMYMGEFDSDANLLTDPRPVTGMEMTVQASAYGSGLLWAVDRGYSALVTFLPDEGDEETYEIESERFIGSPMMLSPWPWRDDSIALLNEMTGDVSELNLRGLSDSGELLVDRLLPWRFPVGVIPAMASLDDYLVVAGAEYDDYGADAGTIHVGLVGDDGDIASSLTVPFERGHFNTVKDISIAAQGAHVLLIWAVRPDLPNHGVWGVLIGCE